MKIDMPSDLRVTSLIGGGARQQNHQVGVLDALKSDLLAIDVTITLLDRRKSPVPVVGSVTPWLLSAIRRWQSGAGSGAFAHQSRGA